MKQKGYRHLDYEVLVHKDKQVPASKWCREYMGLNWSAVGNRSGRWAIFWAGRDAFDQYYVFADQKDAMLFTLTWQ